MSELQEGLQAAVLLHGEAMLKLVLEVATHSKSSLKVESNKQGHFVKLIVLEPRSTRKATTRGSVTNIPKATREGREEQEDLMIVKLPEQLLLMKLLPPVEAAPEDEELSVEEPPKEVFYIGSVCEDEQDVTSEGGNETQQELDKDPQPMQAPPEEEEVELNEETGDETVEERGEDEGVPVSAPSSPPGAGTVDEDEASHGVASSAKVVEQVPDDLQESTAKERWSDWSASGSEATTTGPEHFLAMSPASMTQQQVAGALACRGLSLTQRKLIMDQYVEAGETVSDSSPSRRPGRKKGR